MNNVKKAIQPLATKHIAVGQHLLIDIWSECYLDDADFIKKTLEQCVKACSATLLHIHTHHFSPQGGVSGVAVLSESHISVHTWPELGYAAFDVFMCGNTHPQQAVTVLKAAFSPTRCEVKTINRGT